MTIVSRYAYRFPFWTLFMGAFTQALIVSALRAMNPEFGGAGQQLLAGAIFFAMQVFLQIVFKYRSMNYTGMGLMAGANSIGCELWGRGFLEPVVQLPIAAVMFAITILTFYFRNKDVVLDAKLKAELVYFIGFLVFLIISNLKF